MSDTFAIQASQAIERHPFYITAEQARQLDALEVLDRGIALAEQGQQHTPITLDRRGWPTVPAAKYFSSHDLEYSMRALKRLAQEGELYARIDSGFVPVSTLSRPLPNEENIPLYASNEQRIFGAKLRYLNPACIAQIISQFKEAFAGVPDIARILALPEPDEQQRKSLSV